MTDPLANVSDLRSERPPGRSSFRFTGERRTEVMRVLAMAYRAGASLRELSDKTGLPYSSVQGLLREANVTLRSRGGDTTKKGKATR